MKINKLEQEEKDRLNKIKEDELQQKLIEDNKNIELQKAANIELKYIITVNL